MAEYVDIPAKSFLTVDAFSIDVFEVRTEDENDDVMYHPVITLFVSHASDKSGFALDTEIFTLTPEEAVYAASELGFGFSESFADDVDVVTIDGKTIKKLKVSEIIDEFDDDQDVEVPDGATFH